MLLRNRELRSCGLLDWFNFGTTSWCSLRSLGQNTACVYGKEKGFYLHMWCKGPSGVPYFPVGAAISHSRFSLFWLMSEFLLRKLFGPPWGPATRHSVTDSVRAAAAVGSSESQHCWGSSMWHPCLWSRQDGVWDGSGDQFWMLPIGRSRWALPWCPGRMNHKWKPEKVKRWLLTPLIRATRNCKEHGG